MTNQLKHQTITCRRCGTDGASYVNECTHHCPTCGAWLRSVVRSTGEPLVEAPVCGRELHAPHEYTVWHCPLPDVPFRVMRDGWVFTDDGDAERHIYEIRVDQ